MRIYPLILFALFIMASSLISEEFRVVLERDDSKKEAVFEIEFLDKEKYENMGRRVTFESHEYSTGSIPDEGFFRVRRKGEFSVWGFWTEILSVKDFIIKPIAKEEIVQPISVPMPKKSDDIFLELEKDGKKLQFLNARNLKIQPITDSDKPVSIFYKINNSKWMELKEGRLNFEKDGEYQLDYYSMDILGNKEPVQSVVFLVDNENPSTFLEFESKFASPTGELYVSGNSRITLQAIDSVSGIESTMYRLICGIDEDKPFQVYTQPIPMAIIQRSCQGGTNIEYYSIDRVGNRENTKVYRFQNGDR